MRTQLRKLQRDLSGYAPPALTLRASPGTSPDTGRDAPWRAYSDEERSVSPVPRSLIVKSLVDEMDTPKVPFWFVPGIVREFPSPPGDVVDWPCWFIDLWYSSLPTPYKTRKHYSQLVLELYHAVWEETQRRIMLTRPQIYTSSE